MWGAWGEWYDDLLRVKVENGGSIYGIERIYLSRIDVCYMMMMMMIIMIIVVVVFFVVMII